METNIKRSETIIKKNRDDWFDEKGFLHTKITKEIISGPMDNVQASQRIEEPLLQRIIRPIRLKMRGMHLPPVNQIQQPVQPQQAPDMSALISMGKKLLEDSGIDFQDLVKDAFKTVSKDEPLEDKVEPLTDEKEAKDKKSKKVVKNLTKNQKLGKNNRKTGRKTIKKE